MVILNSWNSSWEPWATDSGINCVKSCSCIEWPQGRKRWQKATFMSLCLAAVENWGQGWWQPKDVTYPMAVQGPLCSTLVISVYFLIKCVLIKTITHDTLFIEANKWMGKENKLLSLTPIKVILSGKVLWGILHSHCLSCICFMGQGEKLQHYQCINPLILEIVNYPINCMNQNNHTHQSTIKKKSSSADGQNIYHINNALMLSVSE